MLTLHTSGGERPVDDSDVIVWLDERGHESFADPQYPDFGYGGCASLARDYARVIAEPWRKLKKIHFAGESVPLHAADLRNPTKAQFEALNTFFDQGAFARIAATQRKGTV